MRDKVEKYVNMAKWEKMNINPGVVRIKSELKEASKWKLGLKVLRRIRRGPRYHELSHEQF